MLLLLLAMTCLASCSATKSTTSKSETMDEVVQEVASAGIQAETAHAEQHSVLHQVETQQTTTKSEDTEVVPAQTSSLTVPTQNLLDLPEGASYRANEGRSSVEARRHGDNIVLTGKCDELARRVTTYEQTVFRQRSAIDSLRNVIHAQQESIAKFKGEAKARDETITMLEQTCKKPNRWYRWLLVGVLLGVALCIAIRILWNRTRLGTIITTLINKVTKLWQK